MEALSNKGISSYLLRLISQYFRNRRSYIQTTDGLLEWNVFGGVPQGSVLGPLIWLIVFYDILRLQLPVSVGLIVYADDLALMIEAI